MSFSLLSVAFALLLIFIISLGISKYRRKGPEQALLSIGATVLGLLLSLAFSPLISDFIVTVVSGIVISDGSSLAVLTEELPMTYKAVQVILEALVNTLIFAVLFFAARRIAKMIIGIICSSAKKRFPSDAGFAKDKEPFYKRNGTFICVLVGVLSAWITCSVVLMPFLGAVRLVLKLTDIVEIASPEFMEMSVTDEETLSDIRNDVSAVSYDAVLGTFYELGGKQLYSASACAYLDFDRVYLLDEIEVLEKITPEVAGIATEMWNKGYIDAEHAGMLLELGRDFEELEILHLAGVDMLSGSSSAWLEGEAFLGMSAPELGKSFDKMLKDIYASCSQTDASSVKTNVSTLLKIISIVTEGGLLGQSASDYTYYLERMSETNILEKINQAFAENPYMSNIRISSMIMTAVADSFSIDEIGAESYDIIMKDIADAITDINNRNYGSHEAKVESMKQYVKDNIKEQGVELPDEVISAMADELLTEVENRGLENVTPDDVSEIIGEYASK